MNKLSVFTPNKLLLSGCFLLIPMSMTATAYAAVNGTTSQINSQNHSNYPADFFAQYQPQNAFDMIERLPGFSFDRGDNARGFGGNAGNVLIDGARPTSKSGGLVGALKRIPAEQIERIEIIRGGVSAGDAAGQSIVANVIKRKDVTSGTYAVKFRRAPHGDLKPNIEAAVNTNLGEWDAAFDIDLGYGPGFRHAVINRYDANDVLTTSAREEKESLGRYSFANGQLSRQFDTGKLTLNGRIGADKWENDQFRNNFDDHIADDTAPDSFWSLNEVNRFETAEFGVDWVQKFDDWKWHSLGLGQVETRKYKNNAYSTENDVITDTGRFSQDRYKSEYIVRNTFGYVGSNKFKPEFGIEAAKNYLDTSLEYFDDGVEQTLDNANVEVAEIRAEIFASFVYAYSEKLSIDGGLTAEFSEIEVTGGNAKKQKFDFLKPRIAANYKLSNDVNVVVEAKHTVGQLNFNDFAASTSAEDDRNVSGNSDLKPEQSTEFSAQLDWSFSEKGSFKVNAYHYWKDDVLEEVILPGGGQGLGNAGSATFWGADFELTIPTDGFLDNGLLEVSYDYSNSELNDNIIGRKRHVSGHLPHDYDVNFRQDLVEQKLAWGLSYNGNFKDTAYRVDEISIFEGNNRLRAFIETSYFAGYKVQLEVSNLNVAKFTRTRQFYEDNRSGAYNGYEVSSRRREPEYKVSIWGTF